MSKCSNALSFWIDEWPRLAKISEQETVTLWPLRCKINWTMADKWPMMMSKKKKQGNITDILMTIRWALFNALMHFDEPKCISRTTLTPSLQSSSTCLQNHLINIDLLQICYRYIKWLLFLVKSWALAMADLRTEMFSRSIYVKNRCHWTDFTRFVIKAIH